MGNAEGCMSEGIIPFAVQDMFSRRDALVADGATVEIYFSYIEVYNEECYDLMSKDRRKLDLKDNQKGELITGQSTHTVANEADVKKLLLEATHARATGATAMNSESSRSHAICTFSIRISSSNQSSSTSNSTLVGKLNLVDLAGSERVNKTKATGKRFTQGCNINKGIHTVGIYSKHT